MSRRRVSRSVRAVAADGERAIARALQNGPAKDEYEELKEVLKEARDNAKALGHRLGHWKRRPYAPNTAADATCLECGKRAMVNLEIGSHAHGDAVENRCAASGTATAE